jgi:hypothetical protein
MCSSSSSLINDIQKLEIKCVSKHIPSASSLHLNNSASDLKEGGESEPPTDSEKKEDTDDFSAAEGVDTEQEYKMQLSLKQVRLNQGCASIAYLSCIEYYNELFLVPILSRHQANFFFAAMWVWLIQMTLNAIVIYEIFFV